MLSNKWIKWFVEGTDSGNFPQILRSTSPWHYNCEAWLQQNLWMVGTSSWKPQIIVSGCCLSFCFAILLWGKGFWRGLWWVMRYGCSTKMPRQKNKPNSGCIASPHTDWYSSSKHFTIKNYCYSILGPRGVLLTEFYKHQLTITYNILPNNCEATQNKRKGMLSSGIVPLTNNTCPHTAQNLLHKFNWELFKHLLHSPTLAQYHFHVFTWMKQ